MIMNAISQALIVLTVITVAFSASLPSGCGWYDDSCPDSRPFKFASCKCDCDGSILCCNLEVYRKYTGAHWSGTAPFCKGRCSDCTNYWLTSDCWWEGSDCGDGSGCWSGSKVLCGHLGRDIQKIAVSF